MSSTPRSGTGNDEVAPQCSPAADACEVVFVSMPFVSVLLPSIGLGLLHAGMKQRGVRSRVHYFNLEFAALAPELYERIIVETSQRDLIGEWIFSRALFGRAAAEHDDAYRALLLAPDFDRGVHSRGMPSHLVDAIDGLREQVEPFLEQCAQRVLEAAPRIVGFTSLFQQHVASLALARRLKQSRPELFVVFGGANCEGPMGRELVRQFPFVDAAVSGEADTVFPALVNRVLEGRSIRGLPAVYGRDAGEPLFPVLDGGQADASSSPRDAPARVELDALPDPDYGDFFAAHERLQLPREEALRIPFETSRGCWWGEKNHCTFCGLNGNTMRHRSKSAARALSELQRLIERHPGCQVEVVDNILDMSYFQDFVPALAEAKLPTELFYEVKANLKKAQIHQLAEAGITTIQPGIENLSDAVLRIMKKGTSGLQNVQLLKWCAAAGVQASWNFLTGFPGEPAEEYRRMAAELPLLFHLRPPAGVSGIRIDRFSPNFDRAEELGFTALRPFPAYHHVFPLPHEAVQRLAYYFTFDYLDGRDPRDYVEPLRQQVELWRTQHEASQLTAVDNDGRLLILDSRAVAPEPVVVLEGATRSIYRAADAVCSPASVARALSRGGDERSAGAERDSISEEQARDTLDQLVERKLMLRDGTRYLALAVLIEDLATAAPEDSVDRDHRAASNGRLAPGAAATSIERGARL